MGKNELSVSQNGSLSSAAVLSTQYLRCCEAGRGWGALEPEMGTGRGTRRLLSESAGPQACSESPRLTAPSRVLSRSVGQSTYQHIRAPSSGVAVVFFTANERDFPNCVIPAVPSAQHSASCHISTNGHSGTGCHQTHFKSTALCAQCPVD